MNCGDFEQIILCVAGRCVAGQQSVDEDAVRQGLAHSEACRRCGIRLAAERALLASVRTVVADMAAQEAPPRLEMALLAAFRQQSRAKAATAGPPTTAWMAGRTRWILAAAAALILAVIATVS